MYYIYKKCPCHSIETTQTWAFTIQEHSKEFERLKISLKNVAFAILNDSYFLIFIDNDPKVGGGQAFLLTPINTPRSSTPAFGSDG